MTIALGSDHGGYCLKNAVMEHLEKKGITLIDKGAYDAKPCNFAEYAEPVCNAVVTGEADLGILVCGTGIGMSMAANKIRGIRCAVLSDVFSAKATRAHNDANVMALGERVIGIGLALEIVDAFLATQFSGDERHVFRLSQVTKLEDKQV